MPRCAARYPVPRFPSHCSDCIQSSDVELHHNGPTLPGTLQLPTAIYMLDYYLPMLSPNEGYNETGLTMQSAGPVREPGNPSSWSFYSKVVNLAIGRLGEGIMLRLPAPQPGADGCLPTIGERSTPSQDKPCRYWPTYCNGRNN